MTTNWAKSILGPDPSKVIQEAKDRLARAYAPDGLFGYDSDTLLKNEHLRARLDVYEGRNEAQLKALENAPNGDRRDITPNPELLDLDRAWSARFLARAKVEGVEADDAGKSVMEQAKMAVAEVLEAVNNQQLKAAEGSIDALKSFAGHTKVIKPALRSDRDRLSHEDDIAFGNAAENFRDVASIITRISGQQEPKLSEPARSHGAIIAGVLTRMANDLDIARGVEPVQAGRKFG